MTAWPLKYTVSRYNSVGKTRMKILVEKNDLPNFQP